MPLHKVTTNQRKLIGHNQFVERGLSVQFIAPHIMNPLMFRGGQDVADAFMRVYGIDLKAAGMLIPAYFDCEIIG